jgi:hypothetical protein
VADIETRRRLHELIPPPGRTRQPPGSRERERATPPRREATPLGSATPDAHERHVDEYA